jgi:hypothetical protein
MAPGEGEGEREGEMEGEGEGEASPLRSDLSMPRDEDGTPYDTAAMLIRLRARAMSLSLDSVFCLISICHVHVPLWSGSAPRVYSGICASAVWVLMARWRRMSERVSTRFRYDGRPTDDGCIDAMGRVGATVQ